MLTQSEETTLNFGQNFGKTLSGGELVLFSGVLGAGKTVFIRGIMESLKVKSKITSPTFNIFRVYNCSFFKNQKKGKVYHFDCYRLKSYKDLATLGIEEILNEKESLVLLEWPECIEEKELKKRKKGILKVKISIKKQGTRTIEIESIN